MDIAYLINETTGERYFLNGIKSIGKIHCNIKVEIDFVVRINYVFGSKYAIISSSNERAQKQMKINGQTIPDGDNTGFRKNLYNFDSFNMCNTIFRLYIIKNKEKLIERAKIGNKIIPLARIKPNSF